MLKKYLISYILLKYVSKLSLILQSKDKTKLLAYVIEQKNEIKVPLSISNEIKFSDTISMMIIVSH